MAKFVTRRNQDNAGSLLTPIYGADSSIRDALTFLRMFVDLFSSPSKQLRLAL